MIFFDIDGTLMDHAQAETAGALAFHAETPALAALPADDFPALWHALAEKHMDRFLAGETDNDGQRRDRLAELFAAAGAPPPADPDAAFARYLAHYEASWRLYPDALPCLDALAPSRLGVISNGSGAQQRRKLERLGLAGRFEVIAISGEVGRAKPHPRIFARACEIAALSPERCTYVGDRDRTDALAAEAAGLRGIHLDRQGAGGKAGRRIRDLAELPALIDTMRAGGAVPQDLEREESL